MGALFDVAMPLILMTTVLQIIAALMGLAGSIYIERRKERRARRKR